MSAEKSFDVEEEIASKTTAALDVLVLQANSGRISKEAFKAGVVALDTATRGLVPNSISELIDLYVAWSSKWDQKIEYTVLEKNGIKCIASRPYGGDRLSITLIDATGKVKREERDYSEATVDTVRLCYDREQQLIKSLIKKGWKIYGKELEGLCTKAK